MKAYNILAIFLMIVIANSLSSCTQTLLPGEATPTTTADSFATPTHFVAPTATPTPLIVQGTISLMHSWEDPYMPALLRQIASFQEEYPGVHFDVLYVPAIDLRASVEAASVEGRGPTVFIAPAGWGPELFDQGWVLDLSPFFGEGVIDTLNPAATGSGLYRQSQISVPIAIEGVVLYRNKQIIPRAPITFADLVELAQAATVGETVGAILERSFFFSGAHLLGLGGNFMDPAGLPAFDDERGVAWLKLLGSFEDAGPTEFFSDNDLQLFKEGRIGFIIESTLRREELAEAIGRDNLAIDPWPIHDQGYLSGFVQADSIYLGVRAQNETIPVSAMFVEYLLSPASQGQVAEVGLIPAINGSRVSTAGLDIRVSDPLISQAMEALVGGSTYPVRPEFAVYHAALDTALQSVFGGEVEPAKALQIASDTVRQSTSTRLITPTPKSE